MGLPNNAVNHEKFRQNAILTATKEDLTLMLYNGALKFANQALDALENDDKEKAHDLIIRVQDIIREFQITLNREYDISKNFASMYDYMYRRLVEANIKKDAEILIEVRDLIREFRDTWKEAMKLARQQSASSKSATSAVIHSV